MVSSTEWLGGGTISAVATPAGLANDSRAFSPSATSIRLPPTSQASFSELQVAEHPIARKSQQMAEMILGSQLE
jgi:hypothetical protein